MSVAVPSTRPKLGLALWVAGMLGFSLITFTVLPDLLPTILQGRKLPFPIWAISTLGLLQAAILLAVAVWAGVATAHSVGLRAPVFESVVGGTPVLPHLKQAFAPGLGFGLLVGVFLLCVNTYGTGRVGAVPSRLLPITRSENLLRRRDRGGTAALGSFEYSPLGSVAHLSKGARYATFLLALDRYHSQRTLIWFGPLARGLNPTWWTYRLRRCFHCRCKRHSRNRIRLALLAIWSGDDNDCARPRPYRQLCI